MPMSSFATSDLCLCQPQFYDVYDRVQESGHHRNIENESLLAQTWNLIFSTSMGWPTALVMTPLTAPAAP